MSTSKPMADKAQPPAARFEGLAIVFAFAILISAFLLFQVQPIISKFILPWFGGSPAVWTTCMLFFQVVLFGGYLYAHGSVRFLSPRAQGLVHLVLLIAAATLLRVTPDASWKPTPEGDPTWRILSLLMATVGLPYFVLSATGPLLQAWFSRSYPGRSPYRLYALSNVGSLLALITYPFVVEPAWDVTTQALAWSSGFWVFLAFCAITAIACLRGLERTDKVDAAAQQAVAPPTMGQRALWLLLPAWASFVWLSTTNEVCQNIPAVPFLYVAPLCLYLLTFIIAFDHSRWYVRRPTAILATVLLLYFAGHHYVKPYFHPGVAGELCLYFTTMFLVCLICHGELVHIRPAPRYLTEFYLLISAGGATGGIFVTLIAPLIFKTLFEWEIALYGSLAIAITGSVITYAQGRAVLACAVVAAALIFSGVGYMEWSGMRDDQSHILMARNFYGALRVDDRHPGEPSEFYMLVNGGIEHGWQNRAADQRRMPTSYYTATSGVGRAILNRQKSRSELNVGVIGLGAGTIAAYCRPRDHFRFYDINPAVIYAATKCFSFLGDAPSEPTIVEGDARLSPEHELAADEPQQFDILVLDAFSGDSIPAHLLTEEAVELYLKHLKPDGVLALHITNTYLDLSPVARGLAKRFDLHMSEIYDEGKDEDASRTNWVLLTKDEALTKAIPSTTIPPGEHGSSVDTVLWTDRYSNLFQLLK